MLFREINIYCRNHRTRKYNVWQNAWFPAVAAYSTYSDHWALNGYLCLKYTEAKYVLIILLAEHKLVLHLVLSVWPLIYPLHSVYHVAAFSLDITGDRYLPYEVKCGYERSDL
jgi:hypothetical protein